MPTPEEESLLERTKMSFGEHLEELRSALIKSIMALVLGTIVGLIFGMQIVDYIQEPLRKGLQSYYTKQAEEDQLRWLQQMQADGMPVPADLAGAAKQLAEARVMPHNYFVSPRELAAVLKPRYPDLAAQLESEAGPEGAEFNREEMISLRLYQPMEEDSRMRAIALNTQEPFVVYMKASMAAGLVLASPFIFYFIWEFVAAGLYKQEQKYVHLYLPISLGLFVIGAALAFYFAFEPMLIFLFWFHEKMHIDPFPRLNEWITTVVLMPLGFGVSFQLPLVMLMLERIGVLSVDAYIRKWRIAVVILAVLAMVITPGGEVSSMMILFVPLTGLYFLGIFMCRRMPGARPVASPDEPEPPSAVAGS